MTANKAFTLEVSNSVLTHFTCSYKNFKLTFDETGIEFVSDSVNNSQQKLITNTVNDNIESHNNNSTNDVETNSETNSFNRLAQKRVTGVTNYIRECKDKSLTLPFTNLERCSTIDIVSNWERRKYQSAFDLLSQLHRIDPRLNGVCIEGLLIQSLGKSIELDIELDTELYMNSSPNAFSSVSNSNIVITHEFDFSFKTTIQAVMEKLRNNNLIDIDFPSRLSYQSIEEITTTEPVNKTFGYTEVDAKLILYLVAYAYISAERRGFSSENYSTDNIIDYATCLIENMDKFRNLCDYMKEVQSTMKTLRTFLSENIDDLYWNRYTPDISIKPIETPKYILHGEIDILETYQYIDEKYHTTDLPMACIYDIKCCKSEDKYIHDWPIQLNLYRMGMKHKFDIRGMYIINVMTNHIIKYNICDCDMKCLV